VQAKLSLAMAAIAVGVTVVLVVSLSWRMNRVGRETLARGEEALLHLLAFQMAPALEFADEETAHSLLLSVTRNPDVRYARVRDRAGRVFAEVARPTAAGDADEATPSPAGALRIARVDVVSENGQRLGEATVGFTLASRRRMERETWQGGVLLGIVVVLLSLLGAFVLSRAITGPISRLTEAVERITTSGDLRQEVDISSRDEVCHLTRSFNQMLAKLDAAMVSMDFLHIAERGASVSPTSLGAERRDGRQRVLGPPDPGIVRDGVDAGARATWRRARRTFDQPWWPPEIQTAQPKRAPEGLRREGWLRRLAASGRSRRGELRGRSADPPASPPAVAAARASAEAGQPTRPPRRQRSRSPGRAPRPGSRTALLSSSGGRHGTSVRLSAGHLVRPTAGRGVRRELAIVPPPDVDEAVALHDRPPTQVSQAVRGPAGGADVPPGRLHRRRPRASASTLPDMGPPAPTSSAPRPLIVAEHGADTRDGVVQRLDAPPVLDDVTVHAKPGEFVAIVGPSGSGKSTLLRLLLGFEAPEAGAVYFDGQDLSAVDVEAVRRQIGVVLQTSQVLAGDLFGNITGSLRLTQDDAWQAAKMAALADEIEAMPMGTYTVCDQQGSNLSGGQRQRLLLARAVACKPRILVLDEATSALDNAGQRQVSESLEGLHVTRVVVAHRLSTIRHADRIVVMRGGRVVQEGRFEELVEAPGLFADLARRQLL